MSNNFENELGELVHRHMNGPHISAAYAMDMAHQLESMWLSFMATITKTAFTDKDTFLQASMKGLDVAIPKFKDFFKQWAEANYHE
jgi:hypothetical protein